MVSFQFDQLAFSQSHRNPLLVLR